MIDFLYVLLFGDGSLTLAYGYTSLVLFVVSTVISLAISYATAPDVKGPRQKDGGVQGEDYGRPIPVWYGKPRGAGQVIYYSGLQEQTRKKSGSGGSTTTYTYTCTAAIAFCEGNLQGGAVLARMWAQKKIIYQDQEIVETGKIKNGVPILVAESITFYDGSDTQLPDPTLQEYLGDEVEAYRGIMYVVVKNIALAELGPRCPAFEAEIVVHDEITVDEVVADIGQRAGVSIDVSLLDGNVPNLDAYAISNDVSVSDAIAPLCFAYYFDVAERGGELVCVPRGMDPVATILREDMGVVAWPGTPGEIEFTRAGEAELPSEVAITYLDISRDMQPLTQRARRNLGSAKENVKIDLPLGGDSNQATRWAHRGLGDAVCGRLTAKGSTSFRWLDVLPGMVVHLEAPTDALLPFRLERATAGANGVIDWDLRYTDSKNYDCDVIGGTAVETGGEGDVGDGGATGPTTWIPLDIPIFKNDQDNAGMFWGVIGTASRWGGAQVYRSTDGGTDYEPIGPFLGPLTTGTVADAAPAGPTCVWDRATRITVTMEGDGELESRSDVSVLNGQNVVSLGDEIFQFAVAEVTGATEEGWLIYELSQLLRGRRGTEWAVGLHEPNERFVLLSDSASLARQDFGASDLDLERLYKPVSAGETVAAVTAVPFTNTGVGLKPFSPARLVGRRQSSGGVEISWHRRSRLISGGFGTGPVPLGEELEGYRLEVFADEAMTSEIITVPLENLSRFLLTDAAQTAAGATPGDPIWLRCAQQSAVRGFGQTALARVS